MTASLMVALLCAELTNDHKALTKAMDGLLQQLHALHKDQNGKAQPNGHTSSKAPALHSIQADAGHGAAANPAQQLHSRPIAQIDEVSMNSPASTAGLQVGLLAGTLGTPTRGKTVHRMELHKPMNERAPVMHARVGHNTHIH